MKPAPADVRAYRERIQARFNLGITQAQDWCAKAVGASRWPTEQGAWSVSGTGGTEFRFELGRRYTLLGNCYAYQNHPGNPD